MEDKEKWLLWFRDNIPEGNTEWGYIDIKHSQVKDLAEQIFNEYIEPALLTQRKEHERIIDEVIGEDERVPEGDYHDKYVAMAVSCNDLREEQRQRAKDLLSKLEPSQ